jgi:hypothetical protein
MMCRLRSGLFSSSCWYACHLVPFSIENEVYIELGLKQAKLLQRFERLQHLEGRPQGLASRR